MLHSFGVKGDGDAKTLDDSKRVQVRGEYISTLFIYYYYSTTMSFSEKSLENPQNMPRYYRRTGQKY